MMLCRDVRQDINIDYERKSQKNMRKLISLLLTACLAAALLTGCGGKASEGGAAAKKTMVIGDTTFNSENWEETVDPHRTYNGWACIRYGIGETLVHYTDAMELEPWLATDWTNDGDCTWTITLRSGVKFSSGRDMDGEAVKQCLNHLLENAAVEELTGEEKELTAQLSSYEEKFDAAMDDDLNTADALAAIFELVRFANSLAEEGSSKAFLRALKEKIVSLADVLGVIVEKKEEMLDADIEALIEERQAARKAKNFARADEIRNELLSKGIVLEDTREGVKWKRA